MHHLRLINALSYDGAVSATKEHPDVFTDDAEKYARAMKSGYFEDLTGSEEETDDSPSEEADAVMEKEDAPASEEKFSEMSVDNLRNYATLNGIDLGSAKKKDDIIRKIEDAERHAKEVRASLR